MVRGRGGVPLDVRSRCLQIEHFFRSNALHCTATARISGFSFLLGALRSFDRYAEWELGHRHQNWRWAVRWDNPEGENSDALGGALRGFIISMNCTLDWKWSGDRVRAVFDELEAVALDLNARAPSAAVQGFQVDSQGRDFGSKYQSMKTDDILRETAVTGIIIQCVFVTPAPHLRRVV